MRNEHGWNEYPAGNRGLHDRSPADYGLAELVGRPTYQRGADYFRAGMAREVFHAGNTWEIAGRVLGSSGADYGTLVSYILDRTGRLDHFEGRCSCPVSIDCKHAVALLLTAFADAELRLIGADGPGPSSWESSLDRMVDLTVQRSGPAEPLGLTFELLPTTSRSVWAVSPSRRLSARCRCGRCGWVDGAAGSVPASPGPTCRSII